MSDRITRAALLAVLFVLVTCLPARAADAHQQPGLGQASWSAALAWLVPVGLGLLACGAVPAGRVAPVIRVGWLALGVSVIGYWLCGFAFQFGGIGFVSGDPGLAGLVREWTWAPLNASWGTGWGVLGLEGYLMRGPASTPAAMALFVAQLPWLTTAVALPLWSLQGRTKPFVLFVAGVLTAFVYTLLGNWTWGGGWLANLGLNLGLGAGFLDLSGASAVHLAGAATALAGMLAFGARADAGARLQQLALPTMAVPDAVQTRVSADGETYVAMPPLHLPLLATLGAWLVMIGSLAWLSSAPAQVALGDAFSGPSTIAALLLAAAGGAGVAMAFSWLVTGEGNALMGARGAVGAVIAAGPGLSSLPLWLVLAVGAGAGLLVPAIQYAVEHLLRFDDPTSALATHGGPALWGLLALGWAADRGWARIESGVTQGQLQAQGIGAAAAALTAFVLSWLFYAAVQGLSRAWQGEYTIRIPRHPLSRRRARRAVEGRRWPRIRIVRAAAEQGDDNRTERKWWRAAWQRLRGVLRRPPSDSGDDAPPAQTEDGVLQAVADEEQEG